MNDKVVIPYQIDTLMQQTRRLASDYRITTGKVLPVVSELAKYDAFCLLPLVMNDELPKGIDACWQKDDAQSPVWVQIKGRLFDIKKAYKQRVTNASFSLPWHYQLLVLYDNHYQPEFIYSASHSTLKDIASQNERGTTLKQWLKTAECVWFSTEEDKR